MSLSKLEQKLYDLDELTKKLAVEVRDNSLGFTYQACVDILSRIKTPATIISNEYNIIYLNSSALELFKKDLDSQEVTFGKLCYKELYGINDVCNKCPVKHSIENKKVYIVDYTSPKGEKYLLISIPLAYNGTSGAIELFVPQ